jgi:SAM-dependent methyltransferase
MSLPAQSLALLLTEHLREPFAGPVLVYGEQRTTVYFGGTLWMFEALGLQPDPAGLVDPPAAETFVDFARVIKMLGLGELHTLDVSAYEGADFIADLNQPVPEEYKGRFGLIIDGGTIEHVFDIRQGMKNTADMLRPGGRVVHVTPVNNCVNHGFVQVSPTFYHDYYVENGFDDVRGVMIVHPRSNYVFERWNFFNYDHETMGGKNSMFCTDQTQLAVYFTARKNAASTSDRVPTQSYFRRQHGGTDTLPNQLVIKHDGTKLNVRRINEPESEESKTTRDLVCSASIWSIDFTARG